MNAAKGQPPLSSASSFPSHMRRVAKAIQARLITALVQVLPRTRFHSINAGVGRLYVLRRPSIHVEDYYRYCQAGLLEALRTNPPAKPVWLTFPDQSNIPPKVDRVVCLQIEHTLVAPGGRDAGEAVPGSVPVTSQDARYLVRLEPAPSAFRRAAGVIEYSAPNIANVEGSELRPLYAGKVQYVAPLLASPTLLTPRRSVSVVTMHGRPHDGRRGTFLRELISLGIEPTNISGVWHDYSHAFERAAILVNVHQTDHHHTLEELRVLPALLHGLIVVTEEVPLLDRVPYGEMLITAPFDSLAKRVRDVAEHYVEYWHELFDANHIQSVYADLTLANARSFREIAASAARGLPAS